jgi:hypothetical protein
MGTQERRGHPGTALDEQPRDTPPGERRQGGRHAPLPVPDAQHLAALRDERVGGRPVGIRPGHHPDRHLAGGAGEAAGGRQAQAAVEDDPNRGAVLQARARGR